MQKIFIKYTVVIMTTAIFLILFINFLFSLHTLKNQQFESFNIKTEQVIHTLENNQAELKIMNENLDEDYLTRAKAAAYVFERQKEIKMNVKEMQYLAKLLNVDELHLIDGNGIIIAASVSKYVGFDMSCHKQTRAFMDILESDDEDALQKMPDSEVCAVVMLDLDYFKSINDTFGHDAGDKYLQGFSDVMKSMPEKHFLTARRSGDEFCMMVYNCASREDIIGFLDGFYEVLGKTYVKLSSTESRTISASAGFAWTSDFSMNITSLLNHADEALYEMKRNAKGSYEEYKG